MKRFSFKSGRSVRVAKLTKTDWLVVLQLEFQRMTCLELVIRGMKREQAGQPTRTKLGNM